MLDYLAAVLVQTHFPRKLAPRRYDQYLASGWFRGSVMLYKVDLLCIESGIYGVVNIRTNLDRFALKKSQRKRELDGNNISKREKQLNSSARTRRRLPDAACSASTNSSLRFYCS